MRLRNPYLLSRLMDERDMTGARLGRRAGVSRQFISQLLNQRRTSCSVEIAGRIEAALEVKPGSLFRADAMATTTTTKNVEVAA